MFKEKRAFIFTSIGGHDRRGGLHLRKILQQPGRAVLRVHALVLSRTMSRRHLRLSRTTLHGGQGRVEPALDFVETGEHSLRQRPSLGGGRSRARPGKRRCRRERAGAGLRLG
jgi:hypothetical protein